VLISREFPEHGSTESFLLDELGLERDGSLVIIADKVLGSFTVQVWDTSERVDMFGVAVLVNVVCFEIPEIEGAFFPGAQASWSSIG